MDIREWAEVLAARQMTKAIERRISLSSSSKHVSCFVCGDFYPKDKIIVRHDVTRHMLLFGNEVDVPTKVCWGCNKHVGTDYLRAIVYGYRQKMRPR